MKKRILAGFMAAVLMLVMAGCSGGGNNSSSSNAGDSKVDKSENTSTSETNNSTDDVESFKMLVWSPSEDQAADSGKWLQTMCEQFNDEHPEWDITFEYGVCAEPDAKTTVTQDVEAAADVYMYANDNITELVANNALSRLGGETEEYIKSTNSETIVDSVSIDGAVYGIPFTTNTWFMYYDKSVFSEEDVKNLDTMLEKGKVSFKLTDSWYIASFYVANGCTFFGDSYDEEKGIDFSGDNAIAVTDYLVDLVANPNFINDADGAGLAGLREGTVNAMFSGSWDYSAVAETLGDNFGAVQLPSITINGEEKQMMSFAGSKAIGVNPNAKNQAAAVALAKYLGSADAQASHYELRNIVPCNTELLEEEAIKNDPLVQAQNNTFENTSIIQPFVPAMGNYWTPAENFGKSLINNEVTHDNAAEMTETLNTAMNTSAAE